MTSSTMSYTDLATNIAYGSIWPYPAVQTFDSNQGMASLLTHQQRSATSHAELQVPRFPSSAAVPFDPSFMLPYAGMGMSNAHGIFQSPSAEQNPYPHQHLSNTLSHGQSALIYNPTQQIPFVHSTSIDGHHSIYHGAEAQDLQSQGRLITDISPTYGQTRLDLHVNNGAQTTG